MADAGILVYGFPEDEACAVRGGFAAACGIEIDLLSASGSETQTVEMVLGAGGSGVYESRDDRFLMFLGFDDTMIRRALDAYALPIRPIFCGLTENNLQWKVAYLMEHLCEERAEHEGRGRR